MTVGARGTLSPQKMHNKGCWGYRYSETRYEPQFRAVSPQSLLFPGNRLAIDQQSHAQALSQARSIADIEGPLQDSVFKSSRVSSQVEDVSAHRPYHTDLPEERGSPTDPVPQGVPS
jgi:hypothetical protein